ncbi:septal ring lytic transglycosylase RlpA family protein [Bradyrhizobium erythrophlei]|uniref:septal ring lytic transglycosylase RlpA family protein n=1 Tax=Bradyrhizobium erythrophlei TaxID=1437360 RepID=UPI0009A7D0B2
MWTLLQHRPSMRDGPSFRRHTQSRLPRYPAKLSRIRTRNLSSEESRHVVRKIAQPLDPSTEFFSGKASYYSYRTGKTASGSSFDRNLPTAAHRSLPFGTRVRVTDLATSKSVVVRITDRGPRVRGRVLDLSLGAARSLAITDRGVAQVRAEVL